MIRKFESSKQKNSIRPSFFHIFYLLELRADNIGLLNLENEDFVKQILENTQLSLQDALDAGDFNKICVSLWFLTVLKAEDTTADTAELSAIKLRAQQQASNAQVVTDQRPVNEASQVSHLGMVKIPSTINVENNSADQEVSQPNMRSYTSETVEEFFFQWRSLVEPPLKLQEVVRIFPFTCLFTSASGLKYLMQILFLYKNEQVKGTRPMSLGEAVFV
ncbi:Armadillo-like helical [Artemisia annua]|uniref:Armadillo-like helical n=1 Tax=Artemisia annua TaxID=35608 RepID=A0A2U1LFN9_ARTAN|nr:Armadillo-like helical [Artemisia annua]